MRFTTLILATGLALACSVQCYGAGNKIAGNLTLPDTVVFTMLGDKHGLAVLEPLRGRVRIATLKSNGRASKWTTLMGLERPVALAADETGLLLVVEKRQHDLTLVSYRDGKPVTERQKLGLKANRKIKGCAARSGILWLVLAEPVEIRLYSFDAKPVARADGVERYTAAPFSVALGADGSAFVTDPMGPAVVTFSGSASFKVRYDLTGTGVTRPSGVAVDAWGGVWVSDGITGRVVCLEPGPQSARIGCAGPNQILYDDPLRLAADPTGKFGVAILECRPGIIMRLEENIR